MSIQANKLLWVRMGAERVRLTHELSESGQKASSVPFGEAFDPKELQEKLIRELARAELALPENAASAKRSEALRRYIDAVSDVWLTLEALQETLADVEDAV